MSKKDRQQSMWWSWRSNYDNDDDDTEYDGHDDEGVTEYMILMMVREWRSKHDPCDDNDNEDDDHGDEGVTEYMILMMMMMMIMNTTAMMIMIMVMKGWRSTHDPYDVDDDDNEYDGHDY